MTQSAHFQVFQASAGAGKTYTIVKEYLKLCLQSEAQTDNFRHILAITFTNAAANEMKAKIVGQLRDIIDSDDTAQTSMGVDLMKELGLASDQLKNNARRLMTRIIHDYSSFCVSTIDAFVQRLSRTFATTSDCRGNTPSASTTKKLHKPSPKTSDSKSAATTLS